MTVLGFVSCHNDINETNFLAGERFTGSNVRVVFVDTLKVETSTMKFDSINTSESSRMLIGKYKDPVFGEVMASSFFELLPDTYTISSEAVFDSIVFYLKQDSYFYNDTLQYNSIHIKRISERLRPSKGDTFYNTSTVSYIEQDIGYLRYRPRPRARDSLGIRMEDSFGMLLFEELQRKFITNQDQFKEYLRGITLQPDETDDGSIIGFSYDTGSSYMSLYYSTSDVNEKVQSVLNFRINRSNSPIPFFNQIKSNAASINLGLLSATRDFLPSNATNEEAYIQSGIGIATRIQFPSIKTIYDLPGKGTILGATLKLKPAIGSYNALLALRDELGVFVVDRNNNLVKQLDISSATLNKMGEAYGDIYYEMPLESYIDELLLTQFETGESLILLPSDYNSTVDRFILNGGQNKDFKATLELTYAIYDEKN